MKIFKSFLCVALCALMLTACGTAKNVEFFTNHIESTNSQIPDYMRYLPEMLADYEDTDDIRFHVADNKIAYSLEGSVEGKSGFTYSGITANIRYHKDSVATVISGLSMDFDENDVTKGVKHEYKDVTYIFTYVDEPGKDTIDVNVIYPLSENVSAYFTVKLDGNDNMDEKTLDKICRDMQMIKL
ncbi:MAG: hypothetical protein IKU08_10685 [Clostridia bacterium]|nr:hypothetical protein [Clostridia bacterium]